MAIQCDLLVIGAGPGGYVAAIRASQLGMKVVLVEKENHLGGTCLNEGCIPSKTLLYYSEQLFEDQTHRNKKGLQFDHMSIDFAKLMQTKSSVVKGLNMGIAGLLKRGKIQHLQGQASFKTEQQVEVKTANGTEIIEPKKTLIATGSKQVELPGLPFDEKRIISSKGALELSEVPKKMVVIGAGVIGLELGSVYNRLGAEVTFVEALDRVGGDLAPEIGSALHKIMTKQGLKFHLSHRFKEAIVGSDQITLKVEDTSNEVKELQADVVLVCVGRNPFTQGLGLENTSVKLDEKGRIEVDGTFKTAADSIFAIGDVIDGPMLAHKASEEGVALVEQLAGHHPKVNYLAVPNVIYTLPEVATVGFTKEQAIKQGFTPKVGQFPFMANSRAHCVDAKDGLALIVTDEKTDVILGMHLICEHAGEMIALGALAIKKKVTARELGALCFPHPTFSEAIKEAALAVHKEAIHF